MGNIIQHMIGNVIDPTFVSVPVQTPGQVSSEPPRSFLEIYGGTVTLDPDGNFIRAKGLSDNSIGYSFCRIIVPTTIVRANTGDPNDNRMVVRTYGQNSDTPGLWQSTVSVGLAGTNPVGGQTAWQSVERADLVLQRETFDDGDHEVLVLGFETYYQNTHLLRVAYNISVAGVNFEGSKKGSPELINNVLPTMRPQPGLMP